MRSRMSRDQISRWFHAWWPSILWAAVIFSMSSDTFSAAHTGSILEPVLRWLFPAVTQEQVDAIHFFVRKSAHFVEYFVFFLLVYRGVRGASLGWRWSWGLAALFIAACYSVLDEIHQAFVVSRTASPYDSLLDSTGALVGFVALWLWFRFLRAKGKGLRSSSVQDA